MANKNPNHAESPGRRSKRGRPRHRSVRRVRPGVASEPEPRAPFDPLSVFPPAPPPQDDTLLLQPSTVLFGGQAFVIRPLQATDEVRLISFFNSHTGETIRQRYGYRIAEMTHERAQRLVGVDQSRDVALGVFERASDGEDVLHAVGRYLLDQHGKSAEMAFVVRETKRGLGICTALMRRLLEIARARGMSYLFAQVQSDNAPMIDVFRRHGGRMRLIPGADAAEAFVPTSLPHDPGGTPAPGL
jgi:GNAT superfamily N-acetyltransferase